MKKLKIAAQLYTVRDFTQTEKDFEETIKKLSEIGYKYVQVSGVGDLAPEFMKEACDKYGVGICATHVKLDLLQDTSKCVEFHNALGCKYAGLGAMPVESRDDAKKVTEFAKMVSGISTALKEHGIQFIYHNHRFEFEKVNQKTLMDYLFDETNEDFQFEIDTHWIQSGGANPETWIRKVAGRMNVVHFKDMKIKANEQLFGEIGYGNLEWDKIIKACLETDVEYAAIEQDRHFDDPFESLKMSYDFLFDNFGEVLL